MNIFQRKFSRKAISATSGLVALLLLGTTRIAHAAWTPFGLESIATTVIGKSAFTVAYIIAWIFGVFIAIEAWLLGIVLQLNTDIFQKAFVQSGFSISLSVANLAFVAGIIVIAIATIIRNESYGIKKLLWKLVVAAVLVNFGLVIAAPIVGMADSLTHYFLDCVNPQIGCAQSSSSQSSYDNFAMTFAGAFQPQQTFALPTGTNTTANGAPTSGGVDALNSNLNGVFSATGSNLGKILVALGGMVVSIVNVLLVVVVMGALVALFLIRYIYISILAILMPFAWASWVFPAFGNHWKKWWDQFLRWTFFAPISVFFIYLAMLLMQGGSNGFSVKQYESSTGSYSAIASFFGNLLSPVLGAFVQEIIFGGLIVGGLIAANAMGLKGAKAVTGAAKDGTKAISGWAGKKVGRTVGDRIRTIGAKYDPETKETISLGQRFGSRIPIIGSRIANYTAPKTIQKERAEEVKKYIEANLTNLPQAALKSRATGIGAFTDPVKATAFAQELAKRGMTNDPDIAKLMPRYVAAAQRIGGAEEIFKSRPDLMPSRSGESPEATIMRGIKSAKGDITHTTPEIFRFTNPKAAMQKLALKDASGKALDANEPADVAQAEYLMKIATLSLSPAQLGVIGSDEEGDERRRAITDSIRKIVTDANLRTGAPGNYKFDTAGLNRLVQTMTADHAPEAQIKAFQNLEGIVRYMNKSGNWADPLES